MAAAPKRSAAPRAKAAPSAGPLALLERVAKGEFPGIVYLDGPDAAIQTAFLAEYRRLWAEAVPDAPLARVLRPDDDDVEGILGVWQNTSMFSPRELAIVFQVEKLVRSEKKIAALAAGLAAPAGGSCLVLVESEGEGERKKLEPVRAAAHVRVTAETPAPGELLEWGRRRLATAGATAEAGALESLLETCEQDALAFLNEVAKLSLLQEDGRCTQAHVRLLSAPRLGADVDGWLLAVAQGDAGLAAQRLERVLAAGESEGALLWALGNMVGGALGGWTKAKEGAALLGRRRKPREVARALDAVYRAEAAWKGGRIGALQAIEAATREVAAR
jgi:DNA polymerase III delta subunit